MAGGEQEAGPRLDMKWSGAAAEMRLEAFGGLCCGFGLRAIPVGDKVTVTSDLGAREEFLL